MRKKSVVAGVVCLAAVLGLGGTASAGERTGTGEHTQAPDHAHSFCAFSGLEDNDFASPVVPGVTQNWGQIVSGAGGHLGGAADVGGDGCNANLYPAN